MNTAMTLKKRIFSVPLAVILLFSMMPLSVFAANDAATVTADDFSLGGDDAANFVLTAQPASTTATVSAKELTIAGLKVQDKPYDGKNIPATGDTPTRSGQLTASPQTMQSPLEKARNREGGACRHCRGGEKHSRDRRHEPSGTLDRAALCQRRHRGRHGSCAQKENMP